MGTLFSTDVARSEIYQFADEVIGGVVSKEDVCWLYIAMDYFVLMEEAKCFGELLKDSQILNELELVEAMIGIIGNFSKKISLLHSSHYGALCYVVNGRLVDVEVILADVRAFEIGIDHKKVMLVYVAHLFSRFA